MLLRLTYLRARALSLSLSLSLFPFALPTFASAPLSQTLSVIVQGTGCRKHMANPWITPCCLRSAAAPRAQPAAAARQPSAGVDKNKTWDPLLLKMVQMSEASGLSTAAAYEALVRTAAAEALALLACADAQPATLQINDLGRWAQASKLYSKAVRTMW